MNLAQLDKMRNGPGFIAALDQSGGSTPKALSLYGVPETAYSNEEEMYAAVHAMRTRIMTSPSFGGDRILAAILFENTMDRKVGDKFTAQYLWEEKQIVPILKVDKGLADAQNGVRLMKPIANLDSLLVRANERGIFGTKMRSVILQADRQGIQAVVDQQFEIAKRIIAAGLVPIIEPEVDIHNADKAECERILKPMLMAGLDKLAEGELVMFKLTLPSEDNFYRECMEHPRMVRVVALSGGYSRDEANAILARNHGMRASFSRALSEGLTAQQSDSEFNQMLNSSIESIFQASMT